jgi:hypothetical protein
VVADDDLDHAVGDARVDVDDDRTRATCVRRGVGEGLVRRQQDVDDLVVLRALGDEPEPEVGPQERGLAPARGQAEAEPVSMVPGCRGYVDGFPPGSRSAAAVSLWLSAANRSCTRLASLERVIRRRRRPRPPDE